MATINPYFKNLMKRNLWKWFGIEDVFHACKNHLNKTDEFLVGRNKPLPSTFITENSTPQTDLLSFVLSAMEDQFLDDVADWMGDQEDTCQWVLYIDALPERFSGRVYVTEEDRFKTCDGTLVILSKYHNGRRFRISTIFPFSSENEPEINDYETA